MQTSPANPGLANEEVITVPKDLGEIASDITITWMQLIAQNRGVSDVEKTLSAENVSRFYSAVCKTVTQCYNFRVSDAVKEKPENW